MQSAEQKARRAERARQNGTKSTGPKTPDGLRKARTATLQHGLYATPDTLKHLIDATVYEEFRCQIQALWNPENRHIATRVDHLVSLMWELDRLIATRREYMVDIFNLNGSSVSDIELLVSRKGDILERIDARIRHLNLEISRIERDLLRLQKHFSSAGPSQKPLKTNTSTPESPWAPHCQHSPEAKNTVAPPPVSPAEPPKPPDTAPRG